MTKQVANLRSIKLYIEMGAGTYTKPDLETLMEELRTFLASVEQQAQTAPMPAPVKEGPVKKKPPQV